MNPRNRSDVETPGDGWASELAGWDPHPRVGGFVRVGPGLGTSASAVPPGRNDPRMVAALEAYLEALRGGQPGSRDEFLARHAEIAEAMGECLSGLEFIQTATPARRIERVGGAPGRDRRCPAAQLGDYRILREVGRGAWAWSTRPSRSRSVAGSP